MTTVVTGVAKDLKEMEQQILEVTDGKTAFCVLRTSKEALKEIPKTFSYTDTFDNLLLYDSPKLKKYEWRLTIGEMHADFLKMC